MSKFCPNCGEELVDSAKFCKNCGKKLENGQTDFNVQDNRPFEVPIVEKSYKLSIVIGYICAVLFPLFGLILGIYLITRKDSENANKHAKFILIITVIIWFLSAMLMRF